MEVTLNLPEFDGLLRLLKRGMLTYGEIKHCADAYEAVSRYVPFEEKSEFKEERAKFRAWQAEMEAASGESFEILCEVTTAASLRGDFEGGRLTLGDLEGRLASLECLALHAKVLEPNSRLFWELKAHEGLVNEAKDRAKDTSQCEFAFTGLRCIGPKNWCQFMMEALASTDIPNTVYAILVNPGSDIQDVIARAFEVAKPRNFLYLTSVLPEGDLRQYPGIDQLLSRKRSYFVSSNSGGILERLRKDFGKK